ncbi:hypothetical protein L195_g040760 [Trifolium pratense]|uniref:Uncharacterized protein n=2 Tax=Trifolium pratense TaxID=57577 RepID=A0A2K3M1N2_TRIPR|nr:hypothetical protein L195_g040760 [Trifolium pratense]
MAISVSRAMSKGVVMTVPVLILTVSVAAIFLFFLLSSLSSCSCPSQQPLATPVNNARNVDVGSSESSKGNGFIATRKEDVEWVKIQIQANGIHMQENVLRKGINPRTRAQQLEDLKQ